MITSPSKIVREHFARAKTSLARDEVLKSVSSALAGIEHLIRGRILGTERFDVDVHIAEYFTEFNRHPLIRAYFANKKIMASPFIRYARGTEKAVLGKLSDMEKELQTMEARQEENREQKKEQRKSELIAKGQEFLDQGDHPRGKGLLRRVAEAYGDEPGVLTDISARLLKAKLFVEAADMLEKAIERFPSDSRAWSLASKAYMDMREFERLEILFKKAVKQFGSHPKTLLNMAKMYYMWHKYDEAYDFAKQALDSDGNLEEAKAIISATEKRIFAPAAGRYKV